MKHPIEQAQAFREDIALQALWYARKSGVHTAHRFFEAVDTTLVHLSEYPELGRER